MKRLIAIAFIALTFLNSCAKKDSEEEKINTIQAIDPLELEFQGVFHAILSPINKQVSGHLNGSLTLVREKDQFVADVRLSGGPGSVMHRQNIHIGTRCPTLEDDLNLDGFIDGNEAAKVFKEIIIPLDDDLNSQWLGLGTFPVSDEYGYYFWSQVASYQKMLEDLKENDINLKDDLIKTSPNKSFTLNENIVVISGVPENKELPESVVGHRRLTKHQALPIACGVIRKLSHVPGYIDTDSTGIPAPNGETLGGSSGADDGAIFYPDDLNNENQNERPDVRDNSTEYDPEVYP